MKTIRERELEGVVEKPVPWRVVKDNAPPPIGERPKCPNCHKRLRPRWVEVSKTGNPREGWVTHVRWEGHWHAYGHFCTLRCGCEYANRTISRGK